MNEPCQLSLNLSNLNVKFSFVDKSEIKAVKFSGAKMSRSSARIDFKKVVRNNYSGSVTNITFVFLVEF